MTAREAESYLRGLEAIGWKLGLERMRLVTQALGLPQNRGLTAHVVGTNGKTSVARQIAALAEAQGVTAGAYVSPHLVSWRERVLVGGHAIEAEAFGEAVGQVRSASAAVERSLGEDERVTQFEAATAAAFVALARRGARVWAIEAGLGGRLDATNVLPSRVTVLTSVGLDHTDWLGDDRVSIALEKLAVLRPATALVHGPDLSPEVERAAREVAAERGARRIVAAPLGDELTRGLCGAHQRRNLALAVAAVGELTGRRPEDELIAGVARAWRAPGRLEVAGGDPPLVLDVAHNPQGAAALAEALPEVAGGREVWCCLALMADKDLAGVVRALAPALGGVVATEVPRADVVGSGRPDGACHPAASIARAARDAGLRAEAVTDPAAAIGRARELAGAARGVALVAGSHYLLRYANGP